MEKLVRSAASSAADSAGPVANKYIGTSTFSVQKLINQRGPLSSMLVISCVGESPLQISMDIIITAGGCGSVLCFWFPVQNTNTASLEMASQTPTNSAYKKFPQSKSQNKNFDSDPIYKLKYSKKMPTDGAVMVMARLTSDYTTDKFVTGMADGTIKVWSASRCVCTQVRGLGTDRVIACLFDLFLESKFPHKRGPFSVGNIFS